VPLSSLLTCSLLLLARLFLFQAALFFTNTFTIPLLLYIPILFLYKNAKAVTGAVSISISTYEEQVCVCALAPSLSPLLIFESFLLPAAAFSFFLCRLQSFSLKDSDEDIFACAPPLQNECLARSLARSASALSRSNKTQREAHMLERSGGNELSRRKGK
jgi:hypothetical protein